MKITATFIDEISHDIPHQNWGREEWDLDFRHMKAVGIDTVIMIRSGYGKFLTYPSKVLSEKYDCYIPGEDLVEMFLSLADKHNMRFFFGLYDSGDQWVTGNMQREISTNQFVIDEVWQKYGHFKSFAGWYLSMEISRHSGKAIEALRILGRQCKEVSSGLPTFISPWIDGAKSVSAASSQIQKDDGISIRTHELEWDAILEGIQGSVDAIAFQDGHINYHELDEYFALNKKLASKYGMKCWTNVETFDRDMPIKFLPIKFEKMRIKLEAAARANYDKAITFEFSHFMSPQSSYIQARHLYNRYKEYIKQ